MKSISLLEFRKKAKAILANVQRGQRFVLTYRGEAVARLEPVEREHGDADDPFYSIHELAVEGGQTLTNREMDRTIYGE